MYNSKKYKAMADKSAEKERLFNEWFTKSYDRLRETLRRYGMLDEDNFHDTYLFVRRQVLVPGKDITDYDTRRRSSHIHRTAGNSLADKGYATV